LEALHHGTIRRILNIQWHQVHEERIRNKQVRQHFYNIPKIESFINKRTATYVSKVARSGDEGLPKKLLGAWMHQPRKAGGQQLSCNNNFAHAITAILPDAHLEKQGLPFKKWIPLASDKKTWKTTSTHTLKPVKQQMKKEKIMKKWDQTPPPGPKQPPTPQPTAPPRARTCCSKTTWNIPDILYYIFNFQN